MVVAYEICNDKPKRLQTQYQQIKGYWQKKRIKIGQKELFCRDFTVQCGKWRNKGDRQTVIMNANEHTIDGKVRQILEAEQLGLVEFSRKSGGVILLTIFSMEETP